MNSLVEVIIFSFHVEPNENCTTHKEVTGKYDNAYAVGGMAVGDRILDVF